MRIKYLVMIACLYMVFTINAQSGYGTYDLNGRNISGGLPIPLHDSQEEGKVVVNILVDPSGKVISTSINKRTNTVNPTLRKSAEDAAYKAIFNAVDGVNNQSGTITYYFRFSNGTIKRHYVDNERCEKEILIQKIDSLERELSYVKLMEELNTLKTDLQLNANNLNISTNGILLNVNSGTYLHSLYNVYKDNYKSSEELWLSYQLTVENAKWNYFNLYLKYSFSEFQNLMLEQTVKMIEQSYSKLKSSLDYYKVCLDMYKDGL